MIKVGVIGLGKMGLLHAGIFNALEISQVSAIAEKNKFLVSVLNRHLPKVNIYTDFEKMLRKENLDAVVITTPVFLHKAMIDSVADYGMNIFVEKPLALNDEECKAVLDNKISHVTSVGYCRRFMDTYRFAKNIIDNSILGSVNFFQSQMYVEQVFQNEEGWLYDPKKSGGGVLMDLGSHAIDMSHYLFGDFDTIHAAGKSIYSESVEDYASLNLKFKNHIFGSLIISWSMRNFRLPELKFVIHLEEGVIIVTEKYIEIYSEVENDSLKKGWNSFYKQNITQNVPIDIGGAEFTAEDVHFLECIKEDNQSICNFTEAAKTNSVIDCAYSSIDDGKTKKVRYGV